MNTQRHNPSARQLTAALLLCLAAVACDRRDAEVPGDSADATNPTAGAAAAPQVDADQALADRTMVDPCAGLSGPALDECRMREDSADVMGQVPDDPMDEPLDADEPIDAAEVPPPVTEEPMESDPAAEDVPPPA